MTDLHFIPWFRRGLAGVASGSAGTTSNISLGLSLAATERAGGGIAQTALPPLSFDLLGPGAVRRVRPEEILRRDPEPNATQVEPNYFASVELKSADLPWRYTLGPPDASNRLTPWIGLIVVEDRAGITLVPETGDQPARISIDDTAQELPPIDEAWAWAHVQYAGALTGEDDDVGTLDAALTAGAPELRARLICPRRLDPNTNYFACIVPLFAAGRDAGLNPYASDTAGPAWDPAGGPQTLPVYNHWRFTTGLRGDFEALVRILTPQLADGAIGLREIDLSQPGDGLPAMREPAVFGGAMVSPGGYETLLKQEQRIKDSDPSALSKSIAERVSAALDLTDKYEASEVDPIVAPPAYGHSYQSPPAPLTDVTDPAWFTALNVRPENRAIAAIGTDVIRQNQDELMDIAWDAVPSLRAANTQLNLSRMAAQVGEASVARFAQLSSADRMRLSAPTFDATPAQGGASVQAQLHASAIPNGLFSGAARRIVRPATGLTAEAGSATPGSDVVEAFLNDPLNEAGRYRDAVQPAGLDPEETSQPDFNPNAGPAGTVYLAQPDPDKRGVAPYKPEPGAEGLVPAVEAAQDPRALLGQSLRTRIPALAGAPETVPPILTVAPKFRKPAYQRLRDMSLDYLVPGVGTLPANSLTMLYSNPYFIRAFMAGLNHEMGREFLWREFPTPLSSTWFQSFWRAGQDDVPPIASWGRATLGGTTGDLAEPADLLLVVRGDLPLRFPNLRLYAVEAKWDEFPGEDGRTYPFRDAKPDGKTEEPAFAGQLTRDTFFFGFNMSADTLRGSNTVGGDPGYFMCFEEVPTQPRFGLEAALPDDLWGEAPDDWQTIRWSNVTPAGSATLAKFVHIHAPDWRADTTQRETNGPGFDSWAEDAASFARQTLQRPARVLFHSSAMLPGSGGAK